MLTSLRVPYCRYFDTREFEAHLARVREQTDVSTEVALFTEYSHRGYWPLDEVRSLASVLKERIPAYRAAGFKCVGLNVLDTLGHMDDGWGLMEAPPMPTLVGIDGKPFSTCLCPSSGEFREYIAEKFRILASCGPDFIWVDDDFKLKNHGGMEICFCPECIGKFNRKYGLSESFETVTQSLFRDANGELSRKWTDFSVDNLTEVAHTIREAVDSVCPDIKMGMMTVPDDHFPEDVLCFEKWMGALRAEKGRPGSGFYTDATPTNILPKFLFCEYQLAHYPPSVSDRQYEVENFPAQDYTKAKTVTRMEFLHGLMTGCNGISFSGTFGYQEERSLYDSREILRENAGLYGKVAELAPALPNRGIYCSDFFTSGGRLMEINLPMTGDRRGAAAFFLTEDAPRAYSDEELIRLLSGGLILDTKAFRYIRERGLGKYCGVKDGGSYDNSIIEEHTEDPFNGEHFGFRRNAWVRFSGMEPCVSVLEPLDGSVRVLSELEDLTCRRLGPCMTYYENELGGRVAVCSYFFPNSIQFEAKRVQWTNLMDALVPGGLPVKVNAKHKVSPILRKNGAGDGLLMLTNMTFDPVGAFSVDVDARDLKRIERDGSLSPVESRRLENGKTRIWIDGLSPWESAVFANR